MKHNKLTGRERVNRAFARRDHDRTPRHDTFWKDTIRRWRGEGLQGDSSTVLEQLETDFQSVRGLYWPAPFPGRREVIVEDANTTTYTDPWGGTVKFFKDRQTTPEHIAWECDSPTAWRDKFRPLIADQPVTIDLKKSRESFLRGRKAGRWCFFCGTDPFEILRKLLGDITYLPAMLEEPEWIADVARVTTENTLKNFQAVWESGIQPDGLWIYGDMAYNHGTLCSPAAYEALIWPSHKHLAEWAHAHGMKFIYHTDGDVNGVIDLYIAAGFDCLQPLEAKAKMDIRELCPRYGAQLAFFGNIDVMVMMSNDPARIEEEIVSKFAAGMATRGYFYHSDHSVPPQVSWKTYQRVISLVGKYGNYS